LIHAVLSSVLGVILLLAPGRFLPWLSQAPIDPIISRILGAARLAMGWGSLQYRRRSHGWS